MDLIFSVTLILGALLMGAISPGPSFVLVARVAMGISRADGIATSIGMGIGGLIFAILSLFGLHAVLSSVPELYTVLKIIGGLYLVYLGVHIWGGACKPLHVSNEECSTRKGTLKKSFLLGLTTQISNPKTALVYGSIFAALLPSNIPASIYFVLPPLVFLVETGWYLVVAIALSTERPRTTYLRSKVLIDRLTGVILGGLGSKLITSSNE